MVKMSSRIIVLMLVVLAHTYHPCYTLHCAVRPECGCGYCLFRR